MSFARRSVPINNENDVPVDLHASRPGKRSILHDIGNPEKRQRFTKTKTTTGAPRRALGDVTNRVNIKKASVSSMGSSGAAAALAKKKQIASKRSISNVNTSSRVTSTLSSRSIGSSISSRNFGNVNVTSRHVGTSSTTSISSYLSRPLSATTPMTSSLRTLGLSEKPSPMVDINLGLTTKPEEEEDHDIDSEDKHDPTMCWPYAEDITNYQLKAEKELKPSSTYMSRQSDINPKMRAILVDWLIDVHYKYGLLPQTLHIAVNLIDRYLESNPSVRRQRLQLVGVAAMFIAAKYEEIYPPEADDFVKITDNAYSKEEVFKMESQMLAAIRYRVTFPTAFQFMKRFLKASRTCDDRVEHFAHYVVDRSLQEYKLVKYLPSKIAAAAVHIARTQMRDTPSWSSTLEHHSSYSEGNLSPCLEELKEILWNTQNNVGKMSKLNAARRKFSKERFMGVAAKPLEFGKSA